MVGSLIRRPLLGVGVFETSQPEKLTFVKLLLMESKVEALAGAICLGGLLGAAAGLVVGHVDMGLPFGIALGSLIGPFLGRGLPY